MKRILLVMMLVVAMAGLASANDMAMVPNSHGALAPLASSGWYCGLLKKCEWYIESTYTYERMLCTFSDGSTNDIYLKQLNSTYAPTVKYTMYVGALETGHYLCSYFDSSVSLFTDITLANH